MEEEREAGPSSLAVEPVKSSVAERQRGAIPDTAASLSQQRRVIRWERFLPKRSLRVLLVEPDDSTRHIVTALLRKCSYHVAAVADGIKAWDIVEEKNFNFDIILSEVEVPSFSGISLLTRIMGTELSRCIPVIMMSSQDSVSVVFKCMQKGAVDFLVKPVRKNELRNLWQHVWRRHCSTPFASGSENVDNNKSASENMSNNSGVGNGTKDSRKDESCDDKDNQSSGRNPLILIKSTSKNGTFLIENEPSVDKPKAKASVDKSKINVSYRLNDSSRSCAKNGFHEKDILNHSAASAFSRYANNGTCLPAQKSRSILATEKSRIQHPFQSLERSELESKKTNGKEEPIFHERPGMIPFAFTVNAPIPFQNFCSGYGPLVQPMFYHEPSQAVDEEGGVHEECQPLPSPSRRLLTESEEHGAEVDRSGIECDPNRSHREAALMKFRQKRKDRCFEKKVRYHSRKMLAEQRPRVKGQFVRQTLADSSAIAMELDESA